MTALTVLPNVRGPLEIETATTFIYIVVLFVVLDGFSNSLIQFPVEAFCDMKQLNICPSM
jgi:hypothetical protein